MPKTARLHQWAGWFSDIEFCRGRDGVLGRRFLVNGHPAFSEGLARTNPPTWWLDLGLIDRGEFTSITRAEATELACGEAALDLPPWLVGFQPRPHEDWSREGWLEGAIMEKLDQIGSATASAVGELFMRCDAWDEAYAYGTFTWLPHAFGTIQMMLIELEILERETELRSRIP